MNRPPDDRAHRRAIILAAERRANNADHRLGAVTRALLGFVEDFRAPEVVTKTYADALECNLAWHELVTDRSVAS